MVEILIFTYYERLICLKYTDNFLGLFGQSFRRYKHCNVVTLNRLSQ